ncbi:MAG: Arm DNA-binding domain-containing protein, partial [Gammaproteobacteria bacterium]|nr:Arm DNA-binding domain-containing protein [Gammaproteobacteria bacterium]
MTKRGSVAYRFTKTSVRSLKPSDRPKEVMDPLNPGFGIKVHPTGRKTWIYRYRTPAGKLRRISLGSYADGHGV